VPSVTIWRIAADTPDYQAHDLTGLGAELTGGRWNRCGTPMVYASTSRALACLETVVHLGAASIPLNRYLVEITVPGHEWASRTTFDRASGVGWDAEPAGMVSLDWGSAWAAGARTLLAEVPSVVVPEESNILINPRHTAAASLRARKVRRWLYDSRLLAGSSS
jgi:RES domain-containing protein